MKIYNYLFFLLFPISIYSCKGDDTTDFNIHETYSLTTIINYVPLEKFSTSTQVVFVNVDGLERYFELKYDDTNSDRPYVNDERYTTESYHITYSGDSDDQFYLDILVSSAYSRHTSGIQEYLTATLTTSANNGYIPMISIDGNGQSFTMGNRLTLNGRSFDDVYQNLTPPADVNSFHTIYYTTKDGIVGYHGEDGELWVLDRFE